jgi:FkbM family methyltransferase
MDTRLKNAARRLLGALGLEVRRRSVLPPDADERRTRLAVLSHAASLGFAPTTVIDVGAAEGTFTRECRQVFPLASYVLVEPLQEFAEPLARLGRSASGIRVHAAAAAGRPGRVRIHVHPDLDGSSLLLEAEGGTVNGTPRSVEAITLDGLLETDGLAGPILLKLDVQGAELEVLAGAPRTLSATEFVLAEVSFYQAFENGPQLADIVTYMKARGFAAYDVCGFLYRPLDGALAQADVAFVREDGLFRRSRAFATPAQRKALDRRFAAAHRARAAESGEQP